MSNALVSPFDRTRAVRGSVVRSLFVPPLAVSLLVLLSVLLSGLPAASVAAAPGSEPVSFNRDVRPILSENCFACHGFDPKHREAGLRLDTFQGATVDRDGTPAIVPGNPAKSLIWERIHSTDPEVVMPPPKSRKKTLTTAQRQILKRWIEEGAKYETHWAFQSPKRESPAANGAMLAPHSAIDHYVERLAKQQGLALSPPAPTETLIRRVSLDLIGLPPTVEEIDAFAAATAKDSEAAYRELVERLLRSPHYGERWGRWWLDQARYADSNGYSIDAPRQIWKYRDWVVSALNADLPFDRFTIEQLAGDLLPMATDDQKIATGFHRNTQINQEGGIDREQFRIDSVFDRVATTGTVWLGLTIGCAQCHDHKFDPIEQREYYRLFAFLNDQDEPTLKVFDAGMNVAELSREFKAVEGKLSAFMKEHASELAAWEAALTIESRKSLSAGILRALEVPKEKRGFAQHRILFAGGIGGVGPFRELNDRYNELDGTLNQGTTTLVLQERATPRVTTVFVNGDFTRPAEAVTPGTPAVLHPLGETPSRPNRLDLAHWIVSPHNPLTARVIVNRVWQQYFGRGIVETENDFGTQGTSPTHPELLDWLAIEFQERKWSLKELHRSIVQSRTYRQSSFQSRELLEKDPENYLLARQRRLRLDAEVVRDVALSASGLLTPKLGGAPVYPPVPAGSLNVGQVRRVWAESRGEDRYRRGLYTFIYRASPPPSLSVFDAPEGLSTCTKRLRSNTPLQALTLLNDGAFFEFAAALEKIIRSDGLETAFRRCTARRPDAEELAVLQRLEPLNAARTLLNLDETVTRE
ncbi:MAG: PSD1 and planctomycete cytochrome C domain-containing protein [Planctomycetota bacterium]